MSAVPRRELRAEPRLAASSGQSAGTAIKGAPAGFFLNPAAILVLMLSLFPFVFSLAMTFTNWNLLYPDVAFQGLENWRRLFEDETLCRAIRNTLFFTVAATCFVSFG